jgi:glycosyltransferase involved in cell wall biosynthesis
VEACAFGKPIVVTETCEIADILAGKAATIVPVNIKDISNAIQELLENAGLRQLFSQGALQLMDSEFSIQAVGDRLETIYTHFQRHKPE